VSLFRKKKDELPEYEPVDIEGPVGGATAAPDPKSWALPADAGAIPQDPTPVAGREPESEGEQPTMEYSAHDATLAASASGDPVAAAAAAVHEVMHRHDHDDPGKPADGQGEIHGEESADSAAARADTVADESEKEAKKRRKAAEKAAKEAERAERDAEGRRTVAEHLEDERVQAEREEFAGAAAAERAGQATAFSGSAVASPGVGLHDGPRHAAAAGVGTTPPATDRGVPAVAPIGGQLGQDKPEVIVLGAFAGAFVLAKILKAITHD